MSLKMYLLLRYFLFKISLTLLEMSRFLVYEVLKSVSFPVPIPVRLLLSYLNLKHMTRLCGWGVIRNDTSVSLVIVGKNMNVPHSLIETDIFNLPKCPHTPLDVC